MSSKQQRTLNSYLRKRDFPVTFKIGCKKHRLVLEVPEGRPLNPSGDFDRVELDDDEFGLTGSFRAHLEKIANLRLRRAGINRDIRTLLSIAPPDLKPGGERRYGGFEVVTMVSSGIVRTFLELCRDMFSNADFEDECNPKPFSVSVQDRVIKDHASSRWNALARDRSARPELQHLVSQIASLFREKAGSTKETQIIRLEIVDFDRTSSFIRSLLDQALEFEALVQPNRERLQKNRLASSRGYLLHRLLCAHFRLAPTSRWDLEISAQQLERLALGTHDIMMEVARHPANTQQESFDDRQVDLFLPAKCPILDEACPAEVRRPGVGFLSCRLPESGHIRDAISLLKRQFLEPPSVSILVRQFPH